MIHDNEFYTGEVFSVYNASALDVKAENNVWDINPAIEVTIIDGNDNPAYGIVDYEPYLPVLPPPDSITFNYETNQLTVYPPTSPTYALLLGYNIYRDNTIIANIVSPNIFFITIPPEPGSTILYGVSCVYDLGESIIVDTLITFPHILNPPQNPQITDTYFMFWEEPEQGSTSPFLYYNVYLDGYFQGTTTELFWLYAGLLPGVYIFEVSAQYEDGESILIEPEYVTAVHNPPSNASYEIFPDHSNLPLEEYRIYVNGELDGTTMELFYDVYDLVSGQTYNVALTAYYIDGIESDPIEFEIMFVGTDDVLTLETKLLGNYPNPFNPSTTISFNLTAEDAKNAKLVIYNLKGQKVRTLINEQLPAGSYTIEWNGKNEKGEISTGIYFYKLTTGDKTFSRKMLLMK